MLFRRMFSRPEPRAKSPRFRPHLEALESRTVLSAGHGFHPAVVVHPGESIQAAVDAAQPGTEILLTPGTYYQSVTVSTPDITLEGMTGPHGRRAVIQNPGGTDNGITVTSTASDFELTNLTVQGFADNGVLLEGVTGFSLTRVTAVDNAEYGLFPVLSSFGTIADCTASGSRDTGIYVGQSSFVSVTHNHTFDNVNGIEIENSSNIVVAGNDTFHNTAGILIDLLPGLTVETSSDILVAGNHVHDNNRPNNGDPGSLESFVPAGTGILVLGADHVTVVGNRVTGNDFVGIGVASSLLLAQIAGLPPSVFDGIEPNPDGALVLANHVVDNGSASPVPGIPGADLLWDGTGTGNLWIDNMFETSVPPLLPGGG
jgi:parallel beta-helix repeat protein